MIDIYISNECYELVRAKALRPFKSMGRQLPNGEWKVPLEQETVDRLAPYQLAGETLSDTIYRLLSTTRGLQ